ncbi:MAG: hypothetical protein Q6373_014780 [Candidatus Sigynarchaeota archaeon]
MSGDIIVKDVPVKLSLEKTIITENLDYEGPKFARKGPLRIIALLLPLALMGVLASIAAAVGYFAGDFGIEFTFWIAFFTVSYYSLLLLRKLLVNAAREAHRVTKITKEAHLKVLKILFGPLAIIMIFIIAAIIIAYDVNAFGLNVRNIYDGSAEGWVQSVAECLALPSTDPDSLYFSPSPMEYVWLIMWISCDLLSAAYCWYAIGFLLYAKKITKKYTFRNEASVVKQLNLTELEQKAFVAVSYGFIPFLTLKSIAQINFGGMMLMVPWWSDTIITALTVLLFVLLLLVPPKQIIADLKAETMLDEFDAKARSILALTDIIQKIDKGEELSLKNAVMALLYSSYLEQVKTFKISNPAGTKKILTALIGPGVSYGAKMASGSVAL